MAQIAIVTGLLTGRINSSFEMATRLQKEGHTIIYLCQPKSQERIEQNGFSCFPVSEITFDYQDPRLSVTASWFEKFKFHYKNLRNHYTHGKKILKLEEHKEVLRAVNPDLVLIDTEIHDFIFTALELKIPVKLITTWFSDTISLKSPSIRTDVIPGKGFSGTKLGVFLSWFKMRIKIHGRVLIDKLTFQNYRRWMFKKYAQEIGYDTTGLLLNTLPPLYSFTKLPIILMTMSEQEFPHKLAKNISYAGPMVYQKREIKDENTKENQRLRVIFELKERENKKLIYCSVSSFVKGDISFLKKVISAVTNEKNWLLIIALGGNITTELLEPVPSNVFLFSWAPQLKILANTDCSINHAGNNTINECLHFTVPMLVYSGKRFDQNGSAARVAYHGMGIRGDKDIDDSRTINKNIFRILNEPSFKSKMTEMNIVYQQYRERELTPLL